MPLSDEQKRAWTILKHCYDRDRILRTNEDIIWAIETSRNVEKVIEPLARYIFDRAFVFADNPKWAGYTDRHDMMSYAIMHALKSVLNFDANKSNNPAAYIVQIFHSAFINYIQNEKKQQSIKADMQERIQNDQLD